MLVQPPQIIRALLPNALWRIKTIKKEVYLSFDDGPTPGVTQKVLEILDQYEAKATFFCIGNNVAKHPKIYQSILQKGHSVGNHTYQHVKGWNTNLQDYLTEVNECAKLVNSNLFRPPFGRITFKQYVELLKTFKIIMWDVVSWDFDASKSLEKCAKNVLNKARNGSIIVFHDSLKAEINCIGALKIVLPELQKQGYSFSALPFSQGPMIS